MTHDPHFAAEIEYARQHLPNYDSYTDKQSEDVVFDFKTILAGAVERGELVPDPAEVSFLQTSQTSRRATRFSGIWSLRLRL